MPTAFHLAKQRIGLLPAAGWYPFRIHRLMGLWSQQSFLPHLASFFAHGFFLLSLLFSLTVGRFLLFSFVYVCVCAPSTLPYSRIPSVFLSSLLLPPPPPLCSFFNLLSFCSLFLSLSFTFFLNFAVSFPQFLLPLQIHPVQCTWNTLNIYCHILSIHVQYTCHLDRVLRYVVV